MAVVECDIPSVSVLDRRLIEEAYFRDSYRAPLSRTRASVVDIFVGIFAHHPMWMKIVLIVRNRIASFCGLDAPTASEIINFEVKNSYGVGDKIGVWPIFCLTETELVAGRDNKHLDFRLSVLRMTEGETQSVVVFHDLHGAQRVRKALSVLHRPIPQMGRTAAVIERDHCGKAVSCASIIQCPTASSRRSNSFTQSVR